MTPTTKVIDSSALLAFLVDSGEDGEWATAEIEEGASLAAPSLLPFEAANILRRHEAAGLLSADQAAQAHADLLLLDVELWPYEVLARRVWELRSNLTAYDAGYVALGETLGAPLVTLDRRIQRAPGHSCAVRTPGGGDR